MTWRAHKSNLFTFCGCVCEKSWYWDFVRPCGEQLKILIFEITKWAIDSEITSKNLCPDLKLVIAKKLFTSWFHKFPNLNFEFSNSWNMSNLFILSVVVFLKKAGIGIS